MKQTIFFFFAFFLIGNAFAQHLSPADKKELMKREDSLKTLAFEILQGRDVETRFAADTQFTRMFVRALKIKGSIDYPFDSLITISRLSPKDSSFKIFTWQLVINEDLVRQHGAIQMRTADGSLKLFPLIDRKEVTQNIADTIADNLGWMGAVYYKLIEKKAFGKTFYTLLGYDENNINSNRKFIEVLTFNEGFPVLGGPFFSFENTTKKPMARYVMEYKKHAGPRLTYDPDLDLIILEHLVSETGEPQKKYTYIPDGDYEGMKWKDGKWVHIEKVFTYVTPEGQEPVPQPIRDAKGNIDESKLNQRTSGIEESNESPKDEAKPKAAPKKKVKKKD